MGTSAQASSPPSLSRRAYSRLLCTYVCTDNAAQLWEDCKANRPIEVESMIRDLTANRPDIVRDTGMRI